MNKILKIALWVTLAISVIVGLVLTGIYHQNKVCKSMEISIDYRGSESFITEDEIRTYLISKSDSIIGKTISEIDEQLIESILNDNPYVLQAEVFVSFNADVNIKLIQRKPLVRIINKQNQQFYLDDMGVKMPVKLACPARVVVVNGNVSSVYTPFISTVSTLRNDTINLAKDTVLYSVFKIAEFLSRNDFFNAQIEEIFVNEHKEIELFPKLGDQIIVFGSIDNLEDKFSKLMVLYKDGFNKIGWDKYSIINLKYNNQVVCTKRSDLVTNIASGNIKN
jgi:cell division protein FtsQ